MDEEKDIKPLGVEAMFAVLQNELKHLNLNLKDYRSENRETLKIASEAHQMASDNAKEIRIVKEWKISIDGWRTWVSRTFWGAVITTAIGIVIAAIASNR